MHGLSERVHRRSGFAQGWAFLCNKCYQRMKEHVCSLGTAPSSVLGTPHLRAGTEGWHACRLPSAQPRS